MPKIRNIFIILCIISLFSFINVYAEEININKEINIDENANIDLNDVLIDAIDNNISNYVINNSNDNIVNIVNNTVIPKSIGNVTIKLTHNTNGNIYNVNIKIIKIYFINGTTSIGTYMKNPINLKNNFDNLKDYNGDITWNVEYPNIVKVENNSIIPISVGESDIFTEINNIKYVYHVKVLDDITNPETASAFSYIIGVVLLLMGIIVIVYANSYHRLSE